VRERDATLERAEDAQPSLAVAPSGPGQRPQRLILDRHHDHLDAGFVEPRRAK
jgi:hypothetical protein